jgi:transcriptional pleiotropic regulator of transition state genes
VTIDGRTYSGYVKNGTFTFYADYLYKGSYNAIIDYQGDAKYNPFSIAKEIVSIAKNPNISLKLNNILINNNIVIRPTVNSTASGSLEIYVDGNMIVLKKYEPACIFCGDAKDVFIFKGKNVCPACAAELKK